MHICQMFGPSVSCDSSAPIYSMKWAQPYHLFHQTTCATCFIGPQPHISLAHTCHMYHWSTRPTRLISPSDFHRDHCPHEMFGYLGRDVAIMSAEICWPDEHV